MPKPEKKRMGPSVAIAKFFNDPGTPMAQKKKIIGEIHELSPEDKQELAELAAAELGVELKTD